MIKPKEIELLDIDGGKHVYTITRFDCISGLKIISFIPAGFLKGMFSKGGESVDEALRLFEIHSSKMDSIIQAVMKFVYVEINGEQLKLSTSEMITNHIPDFETLFKLLYAQLEYNTNFLKLGMITEKLDKFVSSIKPSNTETSIQS